MLFCKQVLPKADASVEHLVASANGGSNNDENCVACCKAVNALLGSMSIKEKFQVVLNQKGQFKCPNGTAVVKTAAPQKDPAVSKSSVVAKAKADEISSLLANLKQRGNSRPRKLATLTNAVASLYPKGLSKSEMASILEQLQATGKVIVRESKVTYAL